MEAEPRRNLAEELAAGLAELEELDNLRTQQDKDILDNARPYLQQNAPLPELECDELLISSRPIKPTACSRCNAVFEEGSKINTCHNPSCAQPALCKDCWDPREREWGLGHSECYYDCESKFCNACTQEAIVVYKFGERGEPQHAIKCPVCGGNLYFAR